MNYAYLLAGGVSAFALVVHVMLGRSQPLPRSGDGEPLLLADAWYGRHVLTIALGVMTFGFSNAARTHGSDDVALMLSMMALLFALLRIAVALRMRTRSWDISQWALVALAGALGAAGSQLA